MIKISFFAAVMVFCVGAGMASEENRPIPNAEKNKELLNKYVHNCVYLNGWNDDGKIIYELRCNRGNRIGWGSPKLIKAIDLINELKKKDGFKTAIFYISQNSSKFKITDQEYNIADK